MADRAVVALRGVRPNQELVIFDLDIFFFGPSISGVDYSIAEIHIAYNDFPQDLRQKFTDEVLAQAVQFGYDVAANDVLVPKFERGS